MVLEALINPFTLKKNPWQMFLGGFFFSIVGLILSYLVFREISGILMVFFIVLATLPMMYTIIKREEELELKYDQEFRLLKEHTKILIFLVFLFLGITTALSLAFIFLPQNVVNTVFSLQTQAIVDVNNYVQGNITNFSIISKIFSNNLKVLFFCLIFSFLYGTGAIFILTWNASVIAAAIGTLVKSEIAALSSLVGFSSLSAYFGITTFSFFRYMTHGFFEIFAYFAAGLAGGIISIALIKHHLYNNKVLSDTFDLILISLGFLIIAAIVEVYLTPILFS